MMIEVTKIHGFGPEEIAELFGMEETEVIEISGPKSTVLNFSTTEDIAYDYARLAYAGQRFHDSAETFEYEEVPAHIHESVSFRVKPKDKKKLAEALNDVALFFKDNSDAHDGLFEAELIDQFVDDATNGTISVACPYFWEVYLENT